MQARLLSALSAMPILMLMAMMEHLFMTLVVRVSQCRARRIGSHVFVGLALLFGMFRRTGSEIGPIGLLTIGIKAQWPPQQMAVVRGHGRTFPSLLVNRLPLDWFFNLP
jgi:hypothetical protein